MPTAPKLYNVRLLVDRFDACVEFYTGLLGLTLPEGHGYPYIEFDTGAGRLALFDRKLMADAIDAPQPPENTGLPAPDRFALIFEVEDVDLAYGEMAQRGALFIAPPTDREAWGIRTAHLRDPDGNLVEVYANLKRAAG